MWAAYTGGLLPDDEYVPVELDVDGVPLPSDDDYLDGATDELPAEAHEIPRLHVVTTKSPHVADLYISEWQAKSRLDVTVSCEHLSCYQARNAWRYSLAPPISRAALYSNGPTVPRWSGATTIVESAWSTSSDY